MTCLIGLTDDELLQRMAVVVYSQSDFTAVKTEILRRIAEKSQVAQTDIDLIKQITENAKAIEDADLDMSRQSQRMKKLSRQYHKLKNQLLSRMKNEGGILSKTA